MCTQRQDTVTRLMKRARTESGSGGTTITATAPTSQPQPAVAAAPAHYAQPLGIQREGSGQSSAAPPPRAPHHHTVLSMLPSMEELTAALEGRPDDAIALAPTSHRDALLGTDMHRPTTPRDVAGDNWLGDSPMFAPSPLWDASTSLGTLFGQQPHAITLQPYGVLVGGESDVTDDDFDDSTYDIAAAISSQPPSSQESQRGVTGSSHTSAVPVGLSPNRTSTPPVGHSPKNTIAPRVRAKVPPTVVSDRKTQNGKRPSKARALASPPLSPSSPDTLLPEPVTTA